MKAKVLFLLPTLSAGGVENYVLRFLKYFLNDFEFHVWSVSEEKGDLYEEFKALNIPLYHRRLGYLNLKKAYSFYTFLKTQQFDTICAFTGNFSGVPLALSNFAQVEKRIVFYRRSTNAFGKNPLKLIYNHLVNLLLKKNATLILSNSASALNFFYGSNFKTNPKFKVIKNGINIEDFDIPISKKEARRTAGLPSEAFIIGHVGRFDPAKNHKTIFKVIQGLKKCGFYFYFVFCGRGTDHSSFEKELQEFDIQDVVITLGVRRDLPYIYKSFDVFYFPSLTEGQPNALIEAMISGLPVITSNISSISEALPSWSDSLTIPPQNVAEAINLLEKFITKEIDASKYTYQEWAKEKFDSEINFKIFKHYLEQ